MYKIRHVFHEYADVIKIAIPLTFKVKINLLQTTEYKRNVIATKTNKQKIVH